jgi:sulfoxide reductase heme-binding subunit YedZ
MKRFGVKELTDSDYGVVVTAFVGIIVVHGLVFLNFEGRGSNTILALIHGAARMSFCLFTTVFIAAPLRHFFPSTLTLWLYKRKRAFGLAFALSHAIFAIAVIWLLSSFPETFGERVPAIRLVSGLMGFVMIAAMALTSFGNVARFVGVFWWRIIHGVSLYSLALAFIANYARQVVMDGKIFFFLPLLVSILAYAFRIFYLLDVRKNRREQNGGVTHQGSHFGFKHGDL